MHHNTAAWSDIVCSRTEQSEVLGLATERQIAGTLLKHHRGHPAPEPRTDSDVEPIAEVDSDPVDEDPPVPHVPGVFEEEKNEPEMLEHEVPEPEDVHEEAPIPVPNRFLVLRNVYGDSLRRIPSAR